MKRYNERLYDDKSHYSLFSVILGLVSLIAWLLPILGIFTSLGSLGTGLVGIDSDQERLAVGGILLGALGFVLTLLRSGLGYFLVV